MEGVGVSLLDRLLRRSPMSKETRGRHSRVAYSTLEADTVSVVDLQMDNRGFEKEGRTIPDEEIHPTISPSEDEYLPHDTDCPCVESQIECSCDKAKPDTSKVELQAWVKPKGWMLIGLSLALVAWCTIYFTLSALQML